MKDPSKTFSLFSSVRKASKVEDEDCIISWYLLSVSLLRYETVESSGVGENCQQREVCGITLEGRPLLFLSSYCLIQHDIL